MTATRSNEEQRYRSLGFGPALLAVVVAGALGAAVSNPLARLLPVYAGRADSYLIMWYVLTSVFAAAVLRVLLRVLRYDITYAAAFLVLVAGVFADFLLLHLLRVRISRSTVPLIPVGSFAASLALVAEIVGLLVTSWLVQLVAVRRRSSEDRPNLDMPTPTPE